jgi:hypothetical protein
METLQTLAVPAIAVIGTLGTILGTIEAFLRRYEKVIAFLTLGIEKYSADGNFREVGY